MRSEWIRRSCEARRNSRTDHRADLSRATGRRVAAISSVMVAALLTTLAPAVADGPPAHSPARAGAENCDGAKRAAYPGPMPIDADPKALRKCTTAVLQSLLNNHVKLQDAALKMVDSMHRQAAVELNRTIVIADLSPKFRPPDADRVREWAGELLDGKAYTLERYYEFKAIYWMEVASRYGRNAMVINGLILDKPD